MSTPLPQSRVRVQRIAEAAVERARLRVVPRLSPNAPRVPFVTLVSVLLLAGVVGLLMFNTHMQQNSFAATELEQQANELTSRQQTLQMELEELRNPQRVAEQAQALGMVPSAHPAFLRITDGKVLGVPTPATPADRDDVRPPAAKKPADLVPPKNVIRVPADSKAKTKAERRAETKKQNRSGRNETSTNDQGDRSPR
ncbi:hypothetical protein ASG90_08965 [Nocardioides sp. Soil797]|nr:hypothetical protein ASG90_08965 [Nocardioides sp. Soil797]